MADLGDLTAHVACPVCKNPVTDVVCWINSEHHSTEHSHPLADTLGYRYEPCGHEWVKAAPPEPCGCRTIVMRTTPELLATWDADARKSQDSARALGITILVSLLVGMVAVALLAWVAIG
jgi:hypothetical protein